jgi:hypothetical protein
MRLGRWLAVAAMAGCSNVDFGPTIEAVMPEAAAAGDRVDILGERFCGDGDTAAAADGACTLEPAGYVHLGGDIDVLRVATEQWRQQRITLTVPPDAPSGASFIVVVVEGVASDPTPFEVR